MSSVLREPINLFDFFHERVDAAAANQRAALSQEGIFYLSNLLAEQSHPEDDDDNPETLVELMLRAREREHDPGGAVSDYRTLGDRALYLSGFFRAHIERGIVGLEYYLHMGAGAYHALSGLLRFGHRKSDFSAIFEELAGRFQACSAILLEVEQEVRSESCLDEPTDEQILALYERWQSTGSLQAARRLQALGLLPGRGPDEAC
ncbi:MAG: hypothetical protein ACI8S6_004473 [Myxococcota bacterium]|jgi:hypothetical protein